MSGEKARASREAAPGGRGGPGPPLGAGGGGPGGGSGALGAGRDWRRALVYGLGVSGVAAARLLRARGVEVVGVDARPRAALVLGGLGDDPGVTLLAGADPPALPAVAGPPIDAVVVSPGVPPDRPLVADARRRGLPVVAEVELAFPLLAGPVVAITGSNGKSTTTAMTGAMLRAAGFAVEVCGNIGEAVSARVDGPPGRVFVVELSSFQLEAVDTFRPRAAALLNLAPDHLDRHGGMGAYAAAKRRLFARQGEGDVAVLNADDPEAAATALAATAARRRSFSRLGAVEDGCFVAGDRVVEAAPGAPPADLFDRADVPVAGAHNLENAMAAALLARALGAAAAAIRGGLAGFRGLPHRMERVADHRGVLWYDDSKGTNAAATAKSLADLPDGRVHLILGGRAKGEDPRVLAPLVALKARRVYLIGEAADDFARALGGAAPCERAGTLERAVAAAAAAARPGDVVLLSPACASFDQFRNYAHRGERFRELVGEVVHAGGAPATPAGSAADGEEARP
jgi:UDP-N-acetylmuramoylalanine--D-glutamate ligase